MTAFRKFTRAAKTIKTAGDTKIGPIKLSQATIDAFRRIANSEPSVPIEPVEPVVSRVREPNRRHKLKTGLIFGDLVLRRKAAPNKKAKPTLRERWHVECTAPGCGKKLIVPKYYLTRKHNPKTHCGCRFATNKSLHAREYRIYHMMHQRCMNPNHESYAHYQKRGIGIYEPWQKHNADGFDLWLEDVGPCPHPSMSLDRIDNRKGYVPGNLRWSTAEEQRLNQGDLIGGKTVEEIEAMGKTVDEWVAHCKKYGY